MTRSELLSTAGGTGLNCYWPSIRQHRLLPWTPIRDLEKGRSDRRCGPTYQHTMARFSTVQQADGAGRSDLARRARCGGASASGSAASTIDGSASGTAVYERRHTEEQYPLHPQQATGTA